MDAAQKLEVIHLLLGEEDRTALELHLANACPGIERVGKAPLDVARRLIEQFSKRAILKDLRTLIDVKHLAG